MSLELNPVSAVSVTVRSTGSRGIWTVFLILDSVSQPVCSDPGVERPFHKSHLKPLESTDICIIIQNRSKIIVMKSQQKYFYGWGSAPTARGTVLKRMRVLERLRTTALGNGPLGIIFTKLTGVGRLILWLEPFVEQGIQDCMKWKRLAGF